MTGWRSRESLSAARRGEYRHGNCRSEDHPQSSSRDIPFNKLVLSQSNVRRVKAGVSIEELAEDIARRTLLQSLNVRPVLDADGAETGMFEVPAGGRRYPGARTAGQAEASRQDRAGALRRARSERDISAEEDSLAENIQRVAAASARPVPRLPGPAREGPERGRYRRRFFVDADRGEAAAAPRRRLRQAPRHLCRGRHDAGAAHGLHRHHRPCAAGAGLGGALSDPTTRSRIRSAASSPRAPVRASDRRARFVGVDAYEAAGGVVLRDLFQHDDGGWLEDVGSARRPGHREAEGRSRDRSPPRAGSGSRSPSTSPTATPTAARARRRRRPTSRRRSRRRSTRCSAEYAKLESEYEGADELPDEVDAAPRRDRDGARRLREPAGPLRSGRDRPRRRLRQHRRRRRPLPSIAAMSDREDEAPVTAADGESETGGRGR